MSGGRRGRFVTTLGAWNSEHKLPFLSTMVVDENPHVRSRAAYHLIEHADRYPADKERAYAVLKTALMQDHGCLLRDGATQGITAYPDKDLATLRADLRKHPSAVVRVRFIEDEKQHDARTFRSKFRAITRAITHGQSGVFTVIRGHSSEGDAARRGRPNRSSEGV